MSGSLDHTQPELAIIDNVALVQILDRYRRYVDTKIMTESVVVITIADCGGISITRIDLTSESRYQIRDSPDMIEMAVREKDPIELSIANYLLDRTYYLLG